MSFIKQYFCILFIIVASISCESPYLDTSPSNTFKVHKSNSNYDIPSLEPHDKVKVVIANTLEQLMIDDVVFRNAFIPHLINEKGEAIDYLFIQHKNFPLLNGVTLEQYLSRQMSKEELSVFETAATVIPNLVIKIPDWANNIIKNIGLERMNFEVIAGVRRPITGLTSSRVNDIIFDAIPIEVKESEKIVPVAHNSTTTFWGDDLIEDHIGFIECPIYVEPYAVYEDSRYRYIDRIELNDALISGELCGVTLPYVPTEVEGCEEVYERDCKEEKNVIEGFKLTNNAVFYGINNQPGGEDVISLHYNFVASQMCGDLSESANCPPTQWKFVFMGTFNDFYEIQVHEGNPLNTEMADVIYIGAGYYVKSYPKYYDLPIDMSFENIYTQAPFLINTGNSTWDGNIYGSVVSFSVHEHDDVIVKASATQSITITNVTTVAASLKLNETFETGADFSNTVTRTSTYTYEIEAEKDVELGQNAANYFDINYSSEGFYGINKTTGSIATHFAYYY